MSKKLTQERLKELLHYDPLTGIFTRLKTASNIVKGVVAGSVNGSGYKQIMIDSKLYTASRLAWLYMEGYFPEHQMDHINRIKSDDRWENLRHVSRQCNARNCNIAKNNRSGITGVAWYKAGKKWKAHIMIMGKKFHLGYYKNKTGAAKVRWKAEVEHDFPNCQTTSSAYLYLQSIQLNP